MVTKRIKRKILTEDNSFSVGLVTACELLCYQRFHFKIQVRHDFIILSFSNSEIIFKIMLRYNMLL